MGTWPVLSQTAPIQKGPTLDSMLCHYHLEIFNNFVFELVFICEVTWGNGAWTWEVRYAIWVHHRLLLYSRLILVIPYGQKGASQVSQWQRIHLLVQEMWFIPELGRSPGEGNGNPLQYSWLGNSMDRAAWWATVHALLKVEHNWVAKQHEHKIHIEPQCVRVWWDSKLVQDYNKQGCRQSITDVKQSWIWMKKKAMVF